MQSPRGYLAREDERRSPAEKVVDVHGRSHRREPIDPAWILARYPA